MRGLLALVFSLAGMAAAQSGPVGLAAVNVALQAGEADKALALLSALPGPEAGSAEAHNLHCRVLITLQQWDGAVNECRDAVKLESRNSEYHMWLGRALGEKADRASFMSAYSLAKEVRQEFETAVQLDGHNAEALADLGEFYHSAPGVVGGGTGKAEGVAAQLDHVDPARAHELRAAIAEGNKDPATAERELRQAIAVSQHPAFQWMALASFLRRGKRWAEMEAAVQSGWDAGQRDRHAGVALYNGGTVLVRANRNPALAVKLFEAYLAGPVKTDEAPAFAAHTALARLHQQMGDTAGARRERDAALALAHEYKPALELRL